MAPPWVLLDRSVKFTVPEGAAATGGKSKDEGRSSRRSGNQPTAIAGTRPWRVPISMDDREKAMAANLEAMKPDPQVSEPPVLSHLSMARQKMAQPVVAGVMLPGRAKISGTDKALVVLYAGQCSPGSGGGCYLVYDASDNSLAAIPELPDRHTFRGLGRGATILSLGEGSYVVAELVEANSGFPNAEVFMWRSPGSRNQEGQWIRIAVRLPRQVRAVPGILEALCKIQIEAPRFRSMPISSDLNAIRDAAMHGHGQHRALARRLPSWLDLDG
ncbi:hypothetical protein EJB05_38917, partial [Eragrostis curvula]